MNYEYHRRCMRLMKTCFICSSIQSDDIYVKEKKIQLQDKAEKGK